LNDVNRLRRRKRKFYQPIGRTVSYHASWNETVSPQLAQRWMRADPPFANAFT
jgi:hypothetical protein